MSGNARRFRIEGGNPRADYRALSLPTGAGMDFLSNMEEMPNLVNDVSEPAPSALLEEIRSLREMFTPLRGLLDNLSDNYKTEIHKVSDLRTDVGEIDEAIRGTKKELAALKVGHHIGGVEVAAVELNTVVQQTEQATNDILAAAESIEVMAGAIQSETTLENAKGLATDIAEKITTIYMACNFQDLAGQRVTRVVETLNFIENRIQRMIESWGGLQALHDLMDSEIRNKEEERATEGDAALANGPMLMDAEDHVDQSAIDALFG